MSVVFAEAHAACGGVLFPCPACAKEGLKSFVLSATCPAPNSRDVSLYRCQDCGTLAYFPFPRADYTSHTDALAIRDYVEMGASIDGPARNLLRVMRRGHKGRLIDIGCGYGFPLDVVRTLAGWEARGFEPSQYGAAGRDELGLEITNDFAVPNPDPMDVYDIVHCSEVIEHVFDAAGFIDLLVSYLAPDGVLVLTTPNADRILPETPMSQLLPLLSPGAHTILFSTKGLSQLLGAAGLTHVQVETGTMSSLFYASRRPIALQAPEDWSDAIARYFDSAMQRATPSTSLHTGLRYRAFRSACDRGRFDLAASLLSPELADAAPRLHNIDSVEQFADSWPLCIPASTYYVAMFLLLHRKRPAEAARHFGAAYLLCRKKIALAPESTVAEADLIWRAVYHKALALKWSGDLASARDTLLAFDTPLLSPPLPEDLVPAVSDLRASLDTPSSNKTRFPFTRRH